jgi:hypothetical protein
VTDQQSNAEPELNAAAIVAALNRYQVRYVIIGAFAAITQQAPIPATRDKESAGRPKDLRVLPLLHRHQSTRRDGDG